MIAAVAESFVNYMSRVVVNIHGAFHVNLADKKHKHKHMYYCRIGLNSLY